MHALDELLDARQEVIERWAQSVKSALRAHPRESSSSEREAFAHAHRALTDCVLSMAEERKVTLMPSEVRALYEVEAESFVRLCEEQRQRIESLEQRLREQESLLRAAEDANRQKDEFLATVSHELRTPLTSMLGWAQLLRAGVASPERQRKGLETIERNARAQTQLIEDLLDVSRIITGKIRLETAVVDVAPILEAVVESMRPTAEAKRLSLHHSVTCASASITGDAGRIQQIIWNLLSNAVKFTPEGGQVMVELFCADGWVGLDVRDTGQGIPNEFLPHVFERFSQADSRANRRHTGLGLGLAITRHLVEMHGGHICVKSDGVGQGAAFEIRLPSTDVRVADRRPGTSLRVDLENPQRFRGLKVLVVEDERDTRELIVTALERHEMIVISVGSAKEGLAAIQTERPDVLVSDIGMPGEDGYAFIRQVRALRPSEGGNVPAIALTAYARREDRRDALNAGFQMYLTKPLSSNELLGVIAQVVDAGPYAGAA